MKTKIYDYFNYQLIVIYHLGALENSIFIIADKVTREACVVDPAWDAQLLIETAINLDYKIKQIWLTHWHPDHVNATDELAKKTNAKVYAGNNEHHFLTKIVKTPINLLDDGQFIKIGRTQAEVVFTPGHTAGGICFLLENDLIAGDTLFIYGAGHCALPGADAQQLFTSMQRIKTLPDGVFVRCGHDYGSQLTTTLGEQKQHNPFLLINNEVDFIRYRQEIHDKMRQYPMSSMTDQEVKLLLQ